MGIGSTCGWKTGGGWSSTWTGSRSRRSDAMQAMELRLLQRADWSELTDLIAASLNYWHATHGRPAVFRDGPEACGYMPEIYEALDPGCCVVAVRPGTGRIMGGCFLHPRETHVSVGI